MLQPHIITVWPSGPSAFIHAGPSTQDASPGSPVQTLLAHSHALQDNFLASSSQGTSACSGVPQALGLMPFLLWTLFCFVRE